MSKTETLSNYTDQQVCAWLRGLLTIAWADGNFDENERELITSLTQEDLNLKNELGDLETISPQELAQALGDDHDTKENFLRTAVMIAIADGVYSKVEADVIYSFHEALGLKVEELKSLESTLWHPEESEELTSLEKQKEKESSEEDKDLLSPIKKWLDRMDIEDPRVAKFICKVVPPQCPFERDVKLFGRKIVHIPAMCELNPLYEQLVGLRFRSLSYLADECQEDVSEYI